MSVILAVDRRRQRVPSTMERYRRAHSRDARARATIASRSGAARARRSRSRASRGSSPPSMSGDALVVTDGELAIVADASI